ncbi:MAG: hypothetical protein KIS81_11220 [Maricaulaceae bacterium]|nr:hypothetical protein [Maricaulaceae bacterium]
MLLVYVLAGSALAISALVALNHFLGGWKPARIESLDQAVARLDADFTGFTASGGVVCADGAGALVEEAGTGHLALVLTRGEDWITRRIGPAELQSAEAGGDGVLIIRLCDFTLPKARLAFSEAEEAQRWAERLNAMQQG